VAEARKIYPPKDSDSWDLLGVYS